MNWIDMRAELIPKELHSKLPGIPGNIRPMDQEARRFIYNDNVIIPVMYWQGQSRIMIQTSDHKLTGLKNCAETPRYAENPNEYPFHCAGFPLS